uniref:Wax synthase domain-containing protein n=1 Tax=Nelumbo nucifera TaxID=4432 RepID=A0A822XUY3_NELNU|nr:TPA_asm: hypothetical protein HUJ06_025016 [Nelumbo nucifera]
MEGEIKSFIKVWFLVIASLSFCYYVVSRIPKGTTAFFVAWLANFKLLLFSFGQGPLSSNPSIPLIHFIFLACLPIKIKQDPPPRKTQQPVPNASTERDLDNPSHQITRKGTKSPLNYAIKGLLAALVVRLYDYRPYLHPKIILSLYCIHVYISLEILLAVVAYLVQPLLNLELEAQFDEPYLSTSLQDFWGRRWNIMVTSILRPTVYEPTKSFARRIVGRKWAPLPAILSTFVVSGLIHELIFFYLGRLEPTWEVTCFFILHGVCLVMEIIAKRALAGRWKLHGAVSGMLSIAFLMITSFWLFFPQFLRCGLVVRGLAEYGAMGRSVRDVARFFKLRSFQNASRFMEN